jgi:Na+/phosphate symporter
MVRDEKERLKQEITALKELKSIAEQRREITHTGLVESREKMFRRSYPQHQHLIGVAPDTLDERIERLEADLRMLENDDLFVDILDDDTEE